VQKDLLASKLAESNPDLSEEARLNLELRDVAKITQIVNAQRAQSPLVDSKGQ